MHILLTNDDGIFSPGLWAIYKKLAALGRITVAAPSDIRSAASHSISLNPVTCEKVDIMGKFEGFSVDGTPADCVKLALNELIDPDKDPVDMIVSGINYGANLGVHVYYSGTVAAAMEGAFHGIPAIALSAAYEEEMNIESAAGYCIDVIIKLMPIEPYNVININIPRLSKETPKGIKVTPHAACGFREGYIAKTDDAGQTVYTFANGTPRDAAVEERTDSYYLERGYITVSALRLDMNDLKRNQHLIHVLSDFAL